MTKQITDAHCPQRAHSPIGLPRGTQGDELNRGSCGDPKQTSDPAPEGRRLPRKDDTGVPKAIRVKRRKTYERLSLGNQENLVVALRWGREQANYTRETIG